MTACDLGLGARGFVCVPCDRVDGGTLPKKRAVKSETPKTAAEPAPDDGPLMTKLEVSFLECWRAWAPESAPAPVFNYQFSETRLWKIDFAWPDVLVAVETEGFDHKCTDRYARDLEKYNTMALQGWALVRITTSLLKRDGHQLVKEIAWTIAERGGWKLPEGEI